MATEKNDRISVTLGSTINLGNFNSSRLDAMYETDVQSGETIEAAYARAWKVVDDEISSKVDPN